MVRNYHPSIYLHFFYLFLSLSLSLFSFFSEAYASRKPAVENIIGIDLEKNNQNPHPITKDGFDFKANSLKDQTFTKNAFLIIFLLFIPFAVSYIITHKIDRYGDELEQLESKDAQELAQKIMPTLKSDETKSHGPPDQDAIKIVNIEGQKEETVDENNEEPTPMDKAREKKKKKKNLSKAS